MQIYSRAPRTYAVYSYGQNIQLHGRHMPDRITMFVGHAAVLDAHLLSIQDAGNVDQSLLTPSGSGTIQPVIVLRNDWQGRKSCGSGIIHRFGPIPRRGRDGSGEEIEFSGIGVFREAYINVKFQ